MTSLAQAWVGVGRAAWAPVQRPCVTERHSFREEEAYNVTRDRNIWSGMAVIISTRIPVFLIDDLYAETGSIDDVIEAYPRLTEGDVFNALAYAREFSALVERDREWHQRAIADAIR
ncbi:MAG TPA: DUF433 domain-containing protein [Longimicrobium sp.]